MISKPGWMKNILFMGSIMMLVTVGALTVTYDVPTLERTIRQGASIAPMPLVTEEADFTRNF